MRVCSLTWIEDVLDVATFSQKVTNFVLEDYNSYVTHTLSLRL